LIEDRVKKTMAIDWRARIGRGFPYAEETGHVTRHLHGANTPSQATLTKHCLII